MTAYVEWSLGVNREHTQHQVRTRFDPDLRAMLASNRFDPYFADWVAICALSEPVTGHTADRREFLGRNGWPGRPASLADPASEPLSGVTSAVMGNCGFTLAPVRDAERALVVRNLERAEDIEVRDVAWSLMDRSSAARLPRASGDAVGELSPRAGI